MKTYWKNLLPVCLLIGIQSCGSPDRNGRDESANAIVDSLSDTTQRAQAQTADVELNGDGKVFALSASTGGIMETEAAGIAVKKSRNKAVKDFAARMLKDHGQANKELNQIAMDKGLQLAQTLPEELAGHVAQLNELADREFDVQYIRMMIKDHQKTVQLFSDGTHLADPDLKAFAVRTLPVIQEHYKMAMDIGKALNISNANNGDDVLGLSPTKIEKK
jgi:putative membrane protein